MAQRSKLNQEKKAELSDNSALVQKLRKLLQKKFRKSYNQFLVEGPSLIEEGLKAQAISNIFTTKEFADSRNLLGRALAQGVNCHLLSLKTIKKLTGTLNPSGIIGISDLQIPSLSTELIAKLRQVIYLDEVQDPGNAGTIIRGAAAFGFDAVIFSTDSVDVTNLKTVRATAGSIFQIPIFLNKELSNLKNWGFEILVTDAKGIHDLREVPVGNKQAWVFSNEARGRRSDYEFATVRIPMKNPTESLNVAQAASVLMFHVSNKMSLA